MSNYLPSRIAISEEWGRHLDAQGTAPSTLALLSKKVAAAHVLAAQGTPEPIIINGL